MVKKAEKKPAASVPESVLKRRKRDEDWAAKKAAAATDSRKKARDQRKEIFKRAETYVKEYRDQVRPPETVYMNDSTPARSHQHLEGGFITRSSSSGDSADFWYQ